MDDENIVNDETARSVTMCCGNRKCPVLSTNKEWITIKDDFGGSVKIPREHEGPFIAAVRELFGIND